MDPTPLPAPPLWLKGLAWILKTFAPTSVKELAIFLAIAASLTGMKIPGCNVKPAPDPAPPAADISLPATAQGPVGRMVQLEATTDGTMVKWWCDTSSDLAVLADSKKAVFTAPKAGTYTVLAWTVLKGQPTDPAQCTITIGDPKPPTPPPPPTPPSPMPAAGLHVLVLSDNKAVYPPAQQAALTAKDVRDYLQAKCVKGADGKTPECRFFDVNQDVSNETQFWKDAFAKAKEDAKGKLPFIMIGAGTQDGFEGDYPADTAGAIALLKKYGG